MLWVEKIIAKVQFLFYEKVNLFLVRTYFCNLRFIIGRGRVTERSALLIASRRFHIPNEFFLCILFSVHLLDIIMISFDDIIKIKETYRMLMWNLGIYKPKYLKVLHTKRSRAQHPVHTKLVFYLKSI